MASVAMNASPFMLSTTPDPGSHSTLPPISSSPSWIPIPDTLRVIVTLLKDSTSAQNSVQNHVYERLETHATHRDFSNYLVYILSRGYDSPSDPPNVIQGVRQAAGLLLKSNISILYRMWTHEARAYAAMNMIAAMSDQSKIVRNVVALCISAIVVAARTVAVLPNLVPAISTFLDSENSNAMDGALRTLSNLAEDVPNILEQDVSRPLDILLPKVIQFCHHQTDSIRARSLQILNHLLLTMPSTISDNVDTFCKTLFSMADDPSIQVRKKVCTAICLLLETVPHTLAPYMQNIVDYMLNSSKHPDEEIAREASEFWSRFVETERAAEILRPKLADLVTVLLKNMVYSTDDITLLDIGDIDDDTIPDRPEDMRPRFHQQRFRNTFSATVTNELRNDNMKNELHSNSVSLPNGNNDYTNNYTSSTTNIDRQSDDEDDEDGWDDLKGEAEWNLRKSSAAALDGLSTLFKSDLLDILLPSLQEKLTNEEQWQERECGVLALGAISEGCYDGMVRHMHSIFPFLLHTVSDQHYMVRSITCWTLSRYAKWVISERDESRIQQLLKVLLERMVDRNKVVQRASCSALASFEEELGSLVSSYITPILRSLTFAFERYQQNNLIVLYDIICTLADAVGNELATPEHMNTLMPLLITRWNAVADTDPALLPLLECLGFVFRALGMRSQQFAGNIFSRCASIMDVVYSREAAGEREDIHVEFLTCCLDLMCGLAEALGPNVDPFMASNGNGCKPVLPLLFVCMKDNRQEVRQSAFALLGELARARIPSLIPALAEHVKYAVDALNPDYMSVSNNATWALGELVMMAGFLPQNVPVDRETIKKTLLGNALEPLIRVVNIPQLNKSLLENSAITLGRMGLVMPEALAPRLGSFAEAVFSALRNIRDDAEKEQAFHGMNAMIKVNPSAIFECLMYYIDAVASWFHCKPDLEMEFSLILTGFKSSLGSQWVQLYNSFPPTLQHVLKERFGL